MNSTLPLAGVKVIEFSHMVMGPSCGLILGDLGADVIKIEPVGAGDNTRRLPGSGAGFFPTFNRNKRSLAIDLKSPKAIAFVKKLIASADWEPGFTFQVTPKDTLTLYGLIDATISDISIATGTLKAMGAM